MAEVSEVNDVKVDETVGEEKARDEEQAECPRMVSEELGRDDFVKHISSVGESVKKTWKKQVERTQHVTFFILFLFFLFILLAITLGILHRKLLDSQLPPPKIILKKRPDQRYR